MLIVVASISRGDVKLPKVFEVRAKNRKKLEWLGDIRRLFTASTLKCQYEAVLPDLRY